MNLEEAMQNAKKFREEQERRRREKGEQILKKFEDALVETIGAELREDQKRAARALATFTMNEMLTHWVDVWEDPGNGLDSGDLVDKIGDMIGLIKQSTE